MAKNIDLDALKLMLDELKANGQIGYEETVLGDTLTWDGTDSDVVSSNNEFHLVSESFPSKEWLNDENNKTNNVSFTFMGNTNSITLGDIVGNEEITGDVFGNLLCAVFVFKDNATIEDVTFPKKGTYFLKNNGNYTQSITIEGANFLIRTHTKVNESYLPIATSNTKGIVDKTEIPCIIYETYIDLSNDKFKQMKTGDILVWRKVIYYILGIEENCFYAFTTESLSNGYTYKFTRSNDQENFTDGVCERNILISELYMFDGLTSCRLRINNGTIVVINDTNNKTYYMANTDIENKSIILNSSTKGSTKRFKITVDDSGTLSATEITE